MSELQKFLDDDFYNTGVNFKFAKDFNNQITETSHVSVTIEDNHLGYLNISELSLNQDTLRQFKKIIHLAYDKGIKKAQKQIQHSLGIFKPHEL